MTQLFAQVLFAIAGSWSAAVPQPAAIEAPPDPAITRFDAQRLAVHRVPDSERRITSRFSLHEPTLDRIVSGERFRSVESRGTDPCGCLCGEPLFADGFENGDTSAWSAP